MKYKELKEEMKLILHVNPNKTEFQIFFIEKIDRDIVEFEMFQRDYSDQQIFNIRRSMHKSEWDDRKRTWEQTLELKSKDQYSVCFNFLFRKFK